MRIRPRLWLLILSFLEVSLSSSFICLYFARAWGYFFIFVDLDVGKKYLTRDYFLPQVKRKLIELTLYLFVS